MLTTCTFLFGFLVTNLIILATPVASTMEAAHDQSVPKESTCGTTDHVKSTTLKDSGTSGVALLQFQASQNTFNMDVDDEEDDFQSETDDENEANMDADEEEVVLQREEDDFDENYESLLDSRRASLKLYVRPTGNDITGDGTINKPYATVKGAVSKKKSAIERATSPTYMYVSGTFFPPDIRSTNPHGGDTTIAVNAPRSAPLIVTPPQGSTVRFEGRAKISDIMTGGWKSFKRGKYGGHIYRTNLVRPVWQLWLGDKSLTVARYPDVARDWFEPWPKTFPLTLTSARGAAPGTWAIANGQKPPQNTSYDDYVDGSKNAGYWGGWFTTDGGDSTKDVQGNKRKNAEWDKSSKTGTLRDSKLAGFDFTGGILHSRMCHKTEFWHPLPITSHNGNRINFRADMNGKIWKGPDECTKKYKYPEKFYIEALDALNMPGEWWYDKSNKQLYVYLEGGARPDQVGTELMGKVNDRALDFSTSKNVVLLGLEFFGTFALAGSGGGGKIESNSFFFPNYPRHILWENILVQNHMAIINQRFVDNDIRYYCYGTVFEGPQVHVENNLIENGIYGCGPMGCGAIYVKSGNLAFVGRNTIRYTQQWHGIAWLAPGFEAAYNHVHDVSTARDDASNFQTKYAGERKSHMHHNWVYNSELKGVRFDTCGDTSNNGHPQCGGAVWNNVFFNMHQGANIKGDYQLVVGNTGFANAKRVDISIPALGVNGTEDGFVYNKFSKTYNNAADILSKSDQRCVLPLPGVSSNSYSATCTQNDKQANTPLKDLLRDPYNLDFRPLNRRYPNGLLNGAKTNVPKFGTGDGSKINIAGGDDIGAYQYAADTYWIPGKMFLQPSTPVPPHTTTTARADLDLMFLGGRGAAHHDVYFARDVCRAWTAGRNSPQHIVRLSGGKNIIQGSLLGGLQTAVWYYWRVDAVASDGSVKRGPLWCFAVGAGDGGCKTPPCGNWAATTGEACATDSGLDNPSTPVGCGLVPETPAPQTTSQPPTERPSECKDTHWKCPTKWKNKCHIARFAKKCPLTCGKCNVGATTTLVTTTLAPQCKDKNKNCPKKKNKCNKIKIQKQCPLTCGKCP